MPSAPFWTPVETKISLLLSALVKRFCVSCVQDFLNNIILIKAIVQKQICVIFISCFICLFFLENVYKFMKTADF